MRRTSLLVLLFSGCWIGPGAVQEKIGVVEPDVHPLHITEIKPNFGSGAGGQKVAIEMLEACENPFVEMGGESAPVVERSVNQLIVRTPSLTGGQWVDVNVTCDEGFALLEDGYQVFRDASDQVRSVGEFSWVEHIGNYWTDEAVDYGSAIVYLFEPIIFDYGDFFGSSMDRCESEYSLGTIKVDSMAEYMDSVTLLSETSEVELSFNEEKGYFGSTLSAADYARNITYSLEPFGDTPPWSDVSVEEFVQTPSGTFSITKPPMNGDVPPRVPSEFDLAWPGAGQGDYVLALIHRYNPDNSYEQIRCLLKDDGHFRVESHVFDQWWSGELMTIRLGRAKRARGSFPQDGAGSGVIGVYWVLGAGYQY